jgi:photosystem II stability/assembly factor-like uncharacterized protein
MRAVLAGRVAALALCILVAPRTAAAATIWERPGGGITFVLAVDPSRPGTVYAGSGRGGIFQSTDAGNTWRRVTRARRPERIYGLVVDGAGTVFAADSDGSVMKSTDSGASWTLANVAPGKHQVRRLAVDRRTRTLWAGTVAGEVHRSTNGGKRWRRRSTGLEGHEVLALAINERTQPSTVFAATTGGVFRSRDGGATWSKVNQLVPRELVVDPTRPHTLFGAREAAFRSTDDGATWRGLGTVRYVLSLAIDARTAPGVAYMGTSYESVLKSSDGGDSWTNAREGLPRWGEVIDLAIDVRTNPSTLYAAPSTTGVYRSTDGGTSWQATGEE